MINFLENKPISWDVVQELLKESKDKNHWTNFGPVSILLEEEIKHNVNLSSDLAVVACASGSLALHCLVNLCVYIENKPIKWAVSSFGFPCSIQGPLNNAIVADCDDSGMLDLDCLNEKDYDGIVVTNVFGLHSVDRYRQFCYDNNKLFICDAATAYDTVSHGENEIISFHHTKPWGMGEGGCIIVAKDHVHILLSIVNFGIVDNEPVGRLGCNGKVSDFASAFIVQRLRQMTKLTPLYREQYLRIVALGNAVGFATMKLLKEGTPCHVPLLANKPIENISNKHVVLRKYYKPLENTPVAKSLYDRIVNVPCHPGMEELSDAAIVEVLEGLL